MTDDTQEAVRTILANVYGKMEQVVGNAAAVEQRQYDDGYTSIFGVHGGKSLPGTIYLKLTIPHGDPNERLSLSGLASKISTSMIAGALVMEVECTVR